MDLIIRVLTIDSLLEVNVLCIISELIIHRNHCTKYNESSFNSKKQYAIKDEQCKTEKTAFKLSLETELKRLEQELDYNNSYAILDNYNLSKH